MMMGLFINKDSLDNNMNLIRETLKQKIEVIQNLQNQLKEYSNLDSTSQAIEVLKTYAKEDIYNNFNQMVEVFNSIINKTYVIQDRYKQLCGNCSLDEDELEENINKLNKVIKIVEDVKYNLDYIDLFDTLPLNQYIIDLIDLKQMYQNKLDGLLEFNQYTNNIFNEEIKKLGIIANNLDRLTDKLENPIEGIDLELTKTNSMFMKINNEEINDVTLEEEKLVGISKDNFSKMYKEQYGFDDEEIELIWKAMVRIYQKYSNVEEAEYQFCLLMGRIGYNAIEGGGYDKFKKELESSVWDNTTGSLGYNDPRDYMVKELGLTSEEANKLYNSIRFQHEFGNYFMEDEFSPTAIVDGKVIESLEKKSFKFFLEGEINPQTGKLYTTEEINNIIDILSNNPQDPNYKNLWYQLTIQNLHGEEGWNDESGWYGDVFGIKVYDFQVIKPSLNNRDYISDLDTVNILELKKQLSVNGNVVSLSETQNVYYQKINSGEINRANYFKNVRPDAMETLKKQAFEDYFSKKYGVLFHLSHLKQMEIMLTNFKN